MVIYYKISYFCRQGSGRGKGFSLVELLVTFAVFSLIIMFVVPSFKQFIMNTKMNTQIDAFVNALNYARSTALSQVTSIKVCPLNAIGSTACGGSWSNGWIVITQPSSGSPVLLQSSKAQPNDAVFSSSTSSVAFSSLGLANNSANFKVCDIRGSNYAGSVMVLTTGYVQSGQTKGQAVWNGGSLSCP